MKPTWCATVLIVGLIAAGTSRGVERSIQLEVRPFIPDVITASEGEVFRGSFAPSGSAFYFFRKVTPGEEDYRIFRTVRTRAGWSEAHWLDRDGHLHFTSTTADWCRTDFRRVEAPVLEMHWSTDPLWQQLAAELPDHHLWSGVVDPTGRRAVLEVAGRRSDGTLTDPDLWVTSRDSSGWQRPRPLGPPVNTDGVENFPTFTPDGSTLVFVRDFAAFYSVSVAAAWQGP